jgi:hypothetical protein
MQALAANRAVLRDQWDETRLQGGSKYALTQKNSRSARGVTASIPTRWHGERNIREKPQAIKGVYPPEEQAFIDAVAQTMENKLWLDPLPNMHWSDRLSALPTVATMVRDAANLEAARETHAKHTTPGERKTVSKALTRAVHRSNGIWNTTASTWGSSGMGHSQSAPLLHHVGQG